MAKSEFHADEPGSRPATNGDAVRQLIYVSTTARRQSDTDMDDLLAQCRRDNERQAITGMLLFKDGHFMQALEGKPDAVESVFERIRRDRRHRDLIAVLDRTGQGRDFADWSMGYRRLDPGDVPGEGFNDILLKNGEPGEGMPLAIRFLKRFAENIR